MTKNSSFFTSSVWNKKGVTKGNCIDNCITESFFGIMKNEMFYGHEDEYKTYEQFENVVKEYIYYYNNIKSIRSLVGCHQFSTEFEISPEPDS